MQVPLLLIVAMAEASAPGAAAGVPAAVLRAESERIAVIEKAKPSVVAVFSPDGRGGGSGVVISPDGYALTNFHVAKPCGDAMKCGLADGRLYDAVIVGIDPTGDIALIKLLGRDNFPAATLGDSDQVRPGDWALVMGNPFGLATDFQPTVTLGIISGVHRYQYPAGTLLEYADCLQTDASINPGNSGGPLFDAAGRLIGINGRGSFEKRGRVNVGVGWAVSINQVKNFLGHLHGGRIVDHATLGAIVGPDAEGRVVVTEILEQSDAYRRGLRYGDEITRFAGRPIDTANTFKNVLGILPKGWRVPLSYRRDGQHREILVRLAGVHSQRELIEKAAGRPPKLPGPKPEPDGKPLPGGPREILPRRKPAKEPPGPEMPGHPPDPEQQAPSRAAAAMPEVVKNVFAARRGYANYYFNRLQRDRVLKAWRADLGPVPEAWTIDARSAAGASAELRLSDNEAALKTEKSQWQWRPDLPAGSVDPPGSGGLLEALHAWRRLALEGPKGFDELAYLGTAPLAGAAGLVDVLAGWKAGTETRFYFEPRQGRLLALEMFPADDVDPCEVYFRDHKQGAGQARPALMEVRFGDETFGVFALDWKQR